MKKEISFIILYYNQYNELLRLINSILYANIEIEYEIIVLDNNSDNVLVLDYYKNINIIHCGNKLNKSFARNIGNKFSKSKYLLYVDSDDYYISINLNKTISQILSSSCSLMISNYLRKNIDNGLHNIKNNNFNKLSLSQSYMILKRNDYIDICFDESVYNFSQEDLFYSVLLLNKTLNNKYKIVINKYFYYYYIKSFKHSIHIGINNIYDDLFKIISSKTVKDILIKRYVKDVKIKFW